METQEITYILPPVSDPDKDSFSITLSNAPTFVSISGRAVSISPDVGDSGSYQTKVILTDEK